MDPELLGLLPLLLGVVTVPLVCVGVTRSAAQGRLARNDVVGLRTRHTRASDAAWQAGHAAALPLVTRIVPTAAGTVVLSVVAGFVVDLAAATVVGLVGFSAEVAQLLVAARTANRAARAVTDAG